MPQQVSLVTTLVGWLGRLGQWVGVLATRSQPSSGALTDSRQAVLQPAPAPAPAAAAGTPRRRTPPRASSCRSPTSLPASAKRFSSSARSTASSPPSRAEAAPTRATARTAPASPPPLQLPPLPTSRREMPPASAVATLTTPTASFVLPLLERQPSRQPKLPPQRSQAELQDALQGRLASIWAETTRANYQSLWVRYRHWCARDNLSPTSDVTAAAFVEAMTDVSVQSRHQYCKVLSAIFSRLGVETPVLRMLAAAYAGEGARRPMHQATPMTPQLLEQALSLFPPWERDALRLAWVTAARWDDIAKSSLASVVQETPEHVIIHFADTKAGRSSPFRPQDLVVVTGRHLPAVRRLLQRVRNESRNNPDAPLTTLTTDDVEALLRPLGLSAHSIKRGALTTLLGLAARNNLPPQALEMLARHQSDRQTLNKTTARYLMGGADSRAQLALYLGTQHATALL